MSIMVVKLLAFISYLQWCNLNLNILFNNSCYGLNVTINRLNCFESCHTLCNIIMFYSWHIHIVLNWCKIVLGNIKDFLGMHILKKYGRLDVF